MFLGKLSDEHCRETYPCLRAKAAETRGTIAALEQVFPRYMDGSEQRHIQAHLALQFSKRIDELLQRHGSWKPSPQEHEELMSCGLSMLLCMSSLTKAFLREGHCLFQLTFKCHWFLHSMELAQYLHPAYCWAYSGEDYMQKMKRLMQSCLRGRQPLSGFGALRRPICLCLVLGHGKAMPLMSWILRCRKKIDTDPVQSREAGASETLNPKPSHCSQWCPFCCVLFSQSDDRR